MIVSTEFTFVNGCQKSELYPGFTPLDNILRGKAAETYRQAQQRNWRTCTG